MPSIIPTIRETKLAEALKIRGINCVSQHWDGHKHVDIFLPEAKIYIEIDGFHHLTNPEQILADFNREHFSDQDEYNTLRINNEILDEHFEKIADAIAQVVEERKTHKSRA